MEIDVRLKCSECGNWLEEKDTVMYADFIVKLISPCSNCLTEAKIQGLERLEEIRKQLFK